LDPGTSSGGVLKLASVSNNITASTLTVANNNNSGTSTLNLGAGTNIVNANTIEMGDSKSTGTIQFNSASGGFRLRNAAGTGRTTVDMAGTPSHSGSSSTAANANILLKGHTVDMMIGTLTMANRAARSGTTANANFSFDAGIVDVTSIIMATNQSGGAAANATLSVGGGTLKVANNISLIGAGGTGGIGQLIVTNGGVVSAGSIIKSTSTGTGNVSITNATVLITSAAGGIGSSAAPIDTLNLSNATVHLKLDANNIPNSSIVANTVNTNGVNNLVIDSIVNASGTVTFSILTYNGGSDPFGSFSGVTLPFGYTGTLQDSGGVVQLNITAPNSVPVTWVGATNSVLVGNWDTNKTQNWLDTATLSTPMFYGDPDPVTFDDSASNSVVTLITTNLPSSVTVNNNTLNYVFSGGGKISGSTGLNKQGAATLRLADSGADDFTGGIVVNGGTVILDQTNSAISGGLTINGGTTAQIGNNDGGGALPAGTLDDEGSLVFSRANNLSVGVNVSGAGTLTQNGNGALTLTVSNGYTGITVASRGTLALTGNGAFSQSPGLLVSNATFDVSTFTTKSTVFNDLSLTNASLNLGTTNLLPAIMATMIESDGTTIKSNVINLINVPAIAFYPATYMLVHAANPITLAGGNFNFVLGSLPAATPSYAGSLSLSADGTSILVTLTAGPVGVRSSTFWAGIDNVNATTNWSDNLNWRLPGAPVAADNVIFDSTTTNNATTVNNVVDTGFTVASLTYNQTNGGYHVTQIPAGNVLTVNNTFTVGNLTLDGAVTHVAFTDAGTLVVNAGNANLVGNSGSTASSGNASLDLSGLSNFVYNASAATFGVGNIGARGQGSIILASGSNNITAGTVAIMTSSASSSVSVTSTLGAGTNIINASTIDIAATRASGTLRFDPAVATGGLRIRGTSGANTDRATVVLGNRSSGGSSGTATGDLLLNDHPVDLKLATLTLGMCNQVTPVQGIGTLQFNQGTVDATGVLMAINTTNGAATGNLTVSGGNLIVGSGGISLVNQTGTGSIPVPSVGNLTLSTATMICSNSIIKATTAGTANVSLTDSALTLTAGTIGTLAAPIDSLTLSDNGTLDNQMQLNIIVGVTNIAAIVNVSGVTTLNINSISGITGTTQIPLISYVGGGSPLAGLPASGLVLGTVPSGYTGASLVDSGSTIDLVITPPAPVVWKGAVGSTLNSSWDTSTFNWLNGVTQVAYADSDFVQFDDTASTNVATLTTTLSPAGLDVSNNVVNYTFTGSGKISGTVGLVKQGTGTLILDNSGINDFSGGVNIAGGTLQIGKNDVNGNIPAGNIIDNGTLALARSDSNTVANLISGSGGLTQSGSGINKLAAINTYNGTTLISGGMLIVTNAVSGNSSIGPTASGAVIITNGGTLDIENPTAQALSFTNTTDSGGKPFFIAGAGVGGNGAIVNNGTVNQQSAIQLLTLTANATIGGPARWDMRVPDGKFQPIMDLGGHTLTKNGSNQMSMVSLIVTNGGSIVINSGILSFETLSSNSTAPITVNAGGVLGHFREQATLFTAPITLNGGMIRDLNGTPGSTNDSPITLTANSFLDLNVNSTDLLRLNGVISESAGSFGLTKTNIGSYSLSATNTYSGTTLVTQGHLILVDNGSISNSKTITVAAGATLDASPRVDSTFALNVNQTLNGFGAVTGTVTTASSSVIAPGSAASIGTLTLVGNTTLSGTNAYKLNRTGSATNDVLAVNGALALGGTLNVSVLAGTPVANDVYTLFTATGGISGTFAATNLPTLSGGLAWDTTNLFNGVLHIVQTVNTASTNITTVVSGNLLTLSWPADHTGWRLQVQTNTLGTGLNTNWVDVAGSTTVNSVNVTMNPANGTVFYRMVYP
ncbi:MAG TPA: autotransporter-associated beta strand repeat-containing protein, partial [Candidatus Acidoferrales bacterium]|nr:autotransporter-associated beta strand repeat-containing protein [Candidatus Acidoferrales bacterium]